MSAAGYVVRWFRDEECLAVAAPKTLRAAMTLLVEPSEDFGEGRVYAVAEDGTETPLPSYEEALAQLAAWREYALADAAATRYALNAPWPLNDEAAKKADAEVWAPIGARREAAKAALRALGVEMDSEGPR